MTHTRSRIQVLMHIGLNGLAIALAVLVVSLTLKLAVSLPDVVAPLKVEARVLETPWAVKSERDRLRLGPTAMSVTPTATPLPPTPLPPTAMPPVPALTAGVKGVNVRTGSSTDYTRVGYLAPGMRAEIVGRSGDWWQILYDGETAWVFGGIVTAVNTEDVPTVSPLPLPTPVPSTPAAPLDQSFDIHEDHWIDVNLSEQQLTAYKDGAPVRSFLVSTGLPATPTPVGRFRIWIKLRYDDMAGPGYYLEDVPFVMYFHEGYGLHGVTWHANFGHRMSHGCVNLPTEAAAWLFDFAEVGTLVNIHE